MKKLLFLISLIIFITPVQANVVINEIMYNPPAINTTSGNYTDSQADYYFEWIELYNPTSENVNITSWTLADNLDTDELECYNVTIENCTIIRPYGYAIITDSDTKIYEVLIIPDNVTKLKTNDTTVGNMLGNSGDWVYLNHSNGTLMDFVNYTGFISVSGGFTLERIDPFGLSNSMSNWDSSKEINGTSGQRNSVTPEEHDLAVYSNNITFSPLDPSPRTGVNITVTIHNLGLYNETNVNVSIYNSSTLVDSRLLNITKRSTTNFTTIWNNTSAGNYTILVSVSNVSGETNLTNNNATKNITIKFRLVLNEIMYNPPTEIGSDVDFEWIEIYNNASYNENLTGWSLKCDTETNSPKTKTLSGTLDSGKYIVLAKDTTEFYTYYSSSIQTVSETCSLNNDGEIIKLGFNDSGIYHEESVTYSSSWGADGTGYSLERVSPNESSWSESIAYGGTPGAKNNPDNKTKSSLKQTEIVYKTSDSSSSGGGSISTSTQKESDYEIVSYQPVVYVGKEFETVVSLKSEVRKNLVVYSYVFDERKLLSEGFDGTKWRKTWNANEKNLIINAGSTATLILKNKIKDDAYAGNYKLRVRILNEKDLTKDITVVLPSEQTLPILAMVCSVDGDKTIVDIRSNVVENATLMIFSEHGMKTKNITIRNQTVETIQETGGYNYIMLVQENKILDECSLEAERPIGITGRAVTTNNLISKIYAWLKSLLSSWRRV